jgi:hypothetical protein
MFFVGSIMTCAGLRGEAGVNSSCPAAKFQPRRRRRQPNLLFIPHISARADLLDTLDP